MWLLPFSDWSKSSTLCTSLSSRFPNPAFQTTISQAPSENTIGLRQQTHSSPSFLHLSIPRCGPVHTGLYFPVWCLHRRGSTTQRCVFVLITMQQTTSVFPQKLKGLRMPTGQQTIQKQSGMVKRTANNLAMTARKQNKTGPPRAKQTARTIFCTPQPPCIGQFHSNRFVFVNNEKKKK